MGFPAVRLVIISCPTVSVCQRRVNSFDIDTGAKWQRIAISRAFMRADEPDVDLLLFDEPVRCPFPVCHPFPDCPGFQTSSLDAHAQNSVFETIDKISRSPQGERIKTVVFITHRLATAREWLSRTFVLSGD
jgi:ABC-type phosphate/phosphonate transport system ATPase subunit